MIREDAQEFMLSDPKANDLFSSVVIPLVQPHIDQLFFLSISLKKNCAVCGALPVDIIPCTMPFLHMVEDPSIQIHAIPLCDKAECMRVHQERLAAEPKRIDDRPEVQAYRASRPGSQNSKIIPTCNICHKSEGAKLCQKCKTIAYCGKEHQKEDWKAHKKVCASLANTNTAKIMMR
jgi:hypothetical protein